VLGHALPELLDERPFSGIHGVERALSPKREGALIAPAELGLAAQAVEAFCERWGGGASLLFPAVPQPSIELGDPWLGLAKTADLDWLCNPGVAPRGAGDFHVDRFHGARVTERHHGELLLPVLASQRRPREEWQAVRSPVVANRDPWAVSYIGTFGRWPEEPSSEVLEASGLRSTATYDRFCETAFDEVAAPGLDDIEDRLRGGASWPAQHSMALLTVPRVTGWSLGMLNPLLPHTRDPLSIIGPNTVVVYEPGSVEDLALLWNLRAAWALPPGLPLAVPATADVPAFLSVCWNRTLIEPWALGSTQGAVVSMSVGDERLADLASRADGQWTAVEPSDVLAVADRPARRSTDIATYSSGVATVASWAAVDRDILGGRPARAVHLNLTVRVRPTSRRIPRASGLVPEWFSAPGYRAGAYQRAAGDSDAVVTVRWPPGWTVLEAAVADHGLDARQSPSGRTASALLRRLGAMNALGAVADAELLDLLINLGESTAMSWFRRRVRDLAEATAESAGRNSADAVEAMERALVDMRVRPHEQDQPEMTYEDVRRALKNSGPATEAWIRWAEEHGLLLRGVGVECSPGCGAKSWRAMDELAPPVFCRGCGEAIERPYPTARGLPFRYRASEMLLQATEADAFPQLFAMRFFCRLFFPDSLGKSELYGAYPGVDLYEPGNPNPIGEADVLLVFTSGRLVPVECKMRSAGLNPAELRKLDDVGERLRAPWTCLATLDRASRCSDLWQPEPDGETPRLALTREHLLAGSVDDQQPWRWREFSDDEFAQAHDAFVGRLPRLSG